MIFGYELIIIVLVAIIGKGILNFEYGIVLFLCTIIPFFLLDLIFLFQFKKEAKGRPLIIDGFHPLSLRPKDKNPKRKKFLIWQSVLWGTVILNDSLAHVLGYGVEIADGIDAMLMCPSMIYWISYTGLGSNYSNDNIEEIWIYYRVLPMIFITRFAIWSVETFKIMFLH